MIAWTRTRSRQGVPRKRWLIARQVVPAIISNVNDVPKRSGQGIELLADRTRRRIIAVLALGPRRPSVLALEIGLSRPAMARQLHLLREQD